MNIDTSQCIYSRIDKLFNDKSMCNSTLKFIFDARKFKNGFKLESYYTPADKIAIFEIYDPNNKMVETNTIPGCRSVQRLWDWFLDEYNKVQAMDSEYDKAKNENNVELDRETCSTTKDLFDKSAISLEDECHYTRMRFNYDYIQCTEFVEYLLNSGYYWGTITVHQDYTSDNIVFHYGRYISINDGKKYKSLKNCYIREAYFYKNTSFYVNFDLYVSFNPCIVNSDSLFEITKSKKGFNRVNLDNIKGSHSLNRVLKYISKIVYDYHEIKNGIIHIYDYTTLSYDKDHDESEHVLKIKIENGIIKESLLKLIDDFKGSYVTSLTYLVDPKKDRYIAFFIRIERKEENTSKKETEEVIYKEDSITLETVLNWFFEDAKEMESREELDRITKFYAKHIIPRFYTQLNREHKL
jgi:hypothetical protein